MENNIALQDRRLPAGIQSFEEIRREGYLYVDKTEIVWALANKYFKYNYLSRPRRFGKSVLVDTLECYFLGKKELFEGLKINQLERNWIEYPVIRLDMSRGGSTAEELQRYLCKTFAVYEEKYNINSDENDSLANRFDAIITSAHQQTGKQVVILIDEYDSPLQHSWKTLHHEECTAIYRNVFAIIKADDVYEKFVFITGITKFTQISLFSALNNLTNISFLPQFAPLCGITEEEIEGNFTPEVEKMGEKNDWSLQETHDRLKEYYDGYHFSEDNMVDVYNPFSLVNALAQSKLGNFWASSGATSLIPKFIDNLELRIEHFEECFIDADTLETSDVTGGGAELFLYQSGYLTIKGYEDGSYILGFPNQEVRQALSKIVMPALVMRDQSDVISTQNLLRVQLNRGNVDEAMNCLKSLISDVPYSNKKMASMDMEERYRLIVSTIFNAIGFRVEVERMHAKGRIDIVVWTVRTIYVIELKLANNGGIESAINQIKNSNYLEPFKGNAYKIIGLAIELDEMGKGVVEWKAVE